MRREAPPPSAKPKGGGKGARPGVSSGKGKAQGKGLGKGKGKDPEGIPLPEIRKATPRRERTLVHFTRF